MTDWLLDTFLYTGVLIALVLLVRRPVSRHFGPQVAYALWALPLLRLIMPPIVLPAAFAPAEPVAVSEPAMVILTASAAAVDGMPVQASGIALTDLLVPIWLFGAAVFLIWRARDYFNMRRDLLAEARSVGEAGTIRLVETPAVSSPVAFGVSDRVVALPPMFMAHYDIAARDMAISHELAHHRGLDLLANIAAQPLLALHWFNPIAWFGWRAMRRDQEAACDARVVAGCKRSEKSAYAQIIADFAAGPQLALAAPMANGMACPILGEKSIIHRLRALTMTEASSGRKKLGIAAIATTALVALPLTASISYAREETPEVLALPDTPTLREAPSETENITIHREFSSTIEDGTPRTHEAVFTNGEQVGGAEMEQVFADLEIGIERFENLGALDVVFEPDGLPQLEGLGERIEMAVTTAQRGRVHAQQVQAQARAQTTSALRFAQRSLQANQAMSQDQRAQAMREIESAIAQIEGKDFPQTLDGKVVAHRQVLGVEAKLQVPSAVQPAQPTRPVRAVRASASMRIQLWQETTEIAEEDCDEDDADFVTSGHNT